MDAIAKAASSSSVFDPVTGMLLLGLLYLVTELVKHVTYRKNQYFFGEEDRHMLEKLSEQHDRVDQDGVPLWYVPRSLISLEEKSLEGISLLIKNQERVVDIIDAISQHLKDIRSTQDEIRRDIARLSGRN